jgi:prolyl oligopeptidase
MSEFLQLTLFGLSNGGLLAATLGTQRPDLYSAVVSDVPLTDLIRMRHMGMGAAWMNEYGDPDVPEQAKAMLGYSPYHHVRSGTEYPAVLFTVFDGDTRVDPMHARKMAAALQDATTAPISDWPILIRAERDVGHGARAVSRTVDLAADQLSFFAARLGLDVP